MRNIQSLFDASVHLVTNALSNVDRLVHDIARDSTRVASDAGNLYDATAAAGSEVRDAVRGAPRFTRIISEVARLVASYRMARARAELIGTGAANVDFTELHERNAQRVYELCVSLRGGVLKVGQFISSRVDLLPSQYVVSLSRLQDQVPPIPADEIRARVERELGRSIDEVFAHFEDQPLAAASLAQVHGAVLLDGTSVAVKVQLPAIEEVMTTDLQALQVVTRMLDDSMPGMNLPTVAAELSRSVRQELDFRREAGTARGFRERFADWDEILVPEVFAQHSTERVMVMERVEGHRLVDFLDQCDPGQRDRLLTTLLRAFAAQMVDHGCFHSDPHPGNFLVVPGGTLAILDFGSVTSMPPEVTRRYAALVASFVARDSASMARLLAELGFVADTPDVLIRNAEAFLEVFGAALVSLDLAAIDPQAELARVKALVRDDPVRQIPDEFVQIVRVFGSLGGLFLRYQPKIKPIAILAPFLARALQQPAS